MIEPPSSKESEQRASSSGDDREGIGWRILYGVPVVLGKFLLGMLVPILLVILLGFVAQKIVGH